MTVKSVMPACSQSPDEWVQKKSCNCLFCKTYNKSKEIDCEKNIGENAHCIHTTVDICTIPDAET